MNERRIKVAHHTPPLRNTAYVTPMVLPDVRSPVAVVIYTVTHTYKQKVLLYSKFMFYSKATANGDRYVREYL